MGREPNFQIDSAELGREIRLLISRINEGDREAEEILRRNCAEIEGYEKRVRSVIRKLKRGSVTSARPSPISGGWFPYRK